MYKLNLVKRTTIAWQMQSCDQYEVTLETDEEIGNDIKRLLMTADASASL